MAEYKYPYIPDKNMYAAVMGACSYIRKTGYFNKAVHYFADKYSVSEKDLAKHIRARQSAGQKAKYKTQSKPRKYHYFIVLHFYETHDGEVRGIERISVEKATSKENAANRFAYTDEKRSYRGEGFYWTTGYFSCALDMPFDTKDVAEKYVIENRSQIIKDHTFGEQL